MSCVSLSVARPLLWQLEARRTFMVDDVLAGQLWLCAQPMFCVGGRVDTL